MLQILNGFAIGDRVEVEFDGTWYGGLVTAASSNVASKSRATFTVSFDDGTFENDVAAWEMRHCSSKAAPRPPRALPRASNRSPTKVNQPSVNPAFGSRAAIGDHIVACDKSGIWCNAKVVDTRMEQEARGRRDLVREVKVHFWGFGARYDEWIRVGSGKLEKPPFEFACAVVRACPPFSLSVARGPDGPRPARAS